MAETTNLYLPGQGKNDGWVLYPEVGSYSAEPEDSTSVLESYGGSEQRRIIYPPGGRTHFVFRTMKLTPEQSGSMRAFLRDLRGRGYPFYFFDFLRVEYVGEFVGLTDGNATLMMPFRDLEVSPTLTVEGYPFIDYTFTADVGNGRETRINWNPTPEAGHTVHLTGSAYKRYVVRREADRIAGRPFAGGETWGDAATPVDLQWDLALYEVI